MRETYLSCTFMTKKQIGEIADGLLDLEMWSTFNGFGPLPGIDRAEFEVRTDEVVGSRIRSHNSDGSSHTETITVWDLPNTIELTFGDFEKPLGLLASGFVERWHFRTENGMTHITREMEMTPRNALGWVALRLIRPLMKRALMRHMREQLGATGG